MLFALWFCKLTSFFWDLMVLYPYLVLPFSLNCVFLTILFTTCTVLQQEEDVLCTWCSATVHRGRYCPSQGSAWAKVQTREAWTCRGSPQSWSGGRPAHRKKSGRNWVCGVYDRLSTRLQRRYEFIWKTAGTQHLCWVQWTWRPCSTKPLIVMDQ